LEAPGGVEARLRGWRGSGAVTKPEVAADGFFFSRILFARACALRNMFLTGISWAAGRLAVCGAGPHCWYGSGFKVGFIGGTE
jgi:hypothetical protein